MTLNDLDWLFRAKICFRAGLAGLAWQAKEHLWIQKKSIAVNLDQLP